MATEEETHQLALDRFKQVEDKEREQRRLSVEDMRFTHAEDGQWDDYAVTIRRNRPRYTINRIAGSINQLVGDQRQNRIMVKVRPVSGGANEDTAQIFNGLIRNIEAQSKAENAYDNAYSETVTGGFGGWRVVTQFNDDDTFEQDIRLMPILSANTSLYFGPAIEYDKRDADWAWLVTEMPIEEFKAKYPNATITDFSQEIYQRTRCKNWFTDNTVRVAEYWVKTPTTKTLGLLSDGRVIDLEEEKQVIDEMAQSGITVIKTSKVKTHKVEMYKMNGAEILEGPTKWAGKYIPLVPVFGEVVHIEQDTYIRGVTRFSKDPSRIYNYTTSAKVEAAALTPLDPIWMSAKQVKGHEEKLENFKIKNDPIQIFNPDPALPGVPQRGGPPSVQNALIEQTQQAAQDIHATTNIYPPSLGNAPQLLSEKSVASQAAMGDRGAFIYQDNLAKSVQYTGDILVDLIPKIYDTPRMVRVLHLDGKSELAQINVQALDNLGQPIKDEQTGQVVMVNDLTQGKYDVVVETGPMSNTVRQETADQLIALASSNPIFEQLGTDLIAKNLNINEGEELTKRVRRLMIQQGTVDPNEEEITEMGLDQPQAPDPSQELLMQHVEAQVGKLMADIENTNADTMKKIMEAQGETVTAFKNLMSGFETQAKAGIPFGRNERDAQIGQLDLVEDSQEAISGEGPNSEQARDLAGQIEQGLVRPEDLQ